jgi:hypothetical protein
VKAEGKRGGETPPFSSYCEKLMVNVSHVLAGEYIATVLLPPPLTALMY